MSPLLRDKYRVLLAANSVSVTKLRRVFPYIGYSASASSVHPCVSDSISTANTSTATPSKTNADRQYPWQSAIDTLDSVMAEFAPHAAIEFVIANQFARYCILPAMPPFTPASERISIATQCFREAYGEAADQWLIRVNPLPHGDSQLCCAIDRLLIDQLVALVTRYRLKLSSLQPAFMHGFNTARRQMRDYPACFVQVEQGRVNLALISNGAWQSLASGLTEHELLDQHGGLSNHWQAELLAMVSRELLLADFPLEQTKALTLYIDTSFVADNVAYKVLQPGNLEHRSKEHSSQDQSSQKQPAPEHLVPGHLVPAYSTWQFVYLAPLHKQPDSPASEQGDESARLILAPQLTPQLTPHREVL